MDQAELDVRILEYYASEFAESNRLRGRSAQGRLEFERVQELLASRIPPESHILDVGGATGIHAAALAELGHNVVLIDPVSAHVEQARQHRSFAAEVGDARDVRFGDDSFDVVLLFGPLYHLVSASSRIHCLREARRVARSGGWVFAAVIPRFAVHADLTLGRKERGTLDHGELHALRDCGEPPAAIGRFPGAHFHTAEELLQEIDVAGLVEAEAHAIEGPSGLALEALPHVDDAVHQAALAIVRQVSHLPGIRDITNHLMGIARVRN